MLGRRRIVAGVAVRSWKVLRNAAGGLRALLRDMDLVSPETVPPLDIPDPKSNSKLPEEIVLLPPP